MDRLSNRWAARVILSMCLATGSWACNKPIPSAQIEMDIPKAQQSFENSEAADPQLVQILKNLHRNATKFTGLYGVTCPKLRVTYFNDMLMAFYRNDTIYLEPQTISALRSAFKDDFNSAMAFVLAHELRHHFKGTAKKMPSNFGNHLIGKSTDEKEEVDADIGGSFWCYLSGYKVRKVIPGTFQALYQAYKIREHHPKGYASFEERLQTVIKLEAIRDTLIQRYHAWSLLTALHFHNLAAQTLLPLEEHLHCPEVSNRLGVSYLLSAVSSAGVLSEKYFSPIVVHQTMPLLRGEIRGASRKKEELLKRAIAFFDAGLKEKPDDKTLITNKATSLYYLNKEQNQYPPRTFTTFLKQKNALLHPEHQQFFHSLTLAFEDGDSAKLRQNFEKLFATVQNRQLKTLIGYNLERVKSNYPTKIDPELVLENSELCNVQGQYFSDLDQSNHSKIPEAAFLMGQMETGEKWVMLREKHDKVNSTLVEFREFVPVRKKLPYDPELSLKTLFFENNGSFWVRCQHPEDYQKGMLYKIETSQNLAKILEVYQYVVIN